MTTATTETATKVRKSRQAGVQGKFVGTQEIPLVDLHEEKAIPQRRVDDKTVDRYAQDYLDGVALPNLLVYRIVGQSLFYRVGGKHRHLAAAKAGKVSLLADVYEGTWHDAILAAAADNQKHGLPLTAGDKKSMIVAVLRDEVWKAKSDNWIAKELGVSQPYVSRLRGELGEATNNTNKSGTRTGTDGRTRNMANTGRPRKATPVTQPYDSQMAHEM